MKRSFGPRGRGRKLGSLFAAFSVLLLVVVILQPAQAALDRDAFELDKNAQDDVTTFRGGLPPPVVTGPLGTLRSNINATQTSFEVCQTSATNPTPLPITILVDGERMTVGTITSPGGGGCSGASKRLYSGVTRSADGDPLTLGAAHSGGENVTLLTFAEVAGDDWDQVFAALQGPNPDTTCAALGAVACTFETDPKETSIFTSSKDFDEIMDWQWRDQSVPDSDELDDGFAVKYVDEDEQNLYFGADRFATNGSKDAGFWFFHDEVATVEGAPGADGTFTGEHTAPTPGANNVFCFGSPDDPLGSPTPNCAPYDADDTGGDILILTTFTNGGAAVTIRIFEWFGDGGSEAALFPRVLVAGDCVPGNSNQSVCATVNDTTIESPWDYLGKGEPVAKEINAGGFLEGGINLSDFGLEGCFSSFMATSRSAPSLTADPKDFILGSFEACASNLTTTPADGSGTELVDGNDTDTLPETQIGTGSAGVDVTDLADVVVAGTPTWSGTLSFFLCGPIADPATCTTGGVPIGSPIAIDQDDPQPIESASANLTEVGRYCWRGEFTSDDEQVPGDTDASVGECFEVDPVEPELTTTAVAESEGLSPTIIGSLADLNGDGVVDGDDNSNEFYGSTSILGGALDCNNWTTDNDGAAGDGTIDGLDNCTLIGFDGTADGVMIEVVAGEFATADGVAIPDGTTLPTVFNALDPDNPDVGDSDFAWSTIFGRVDSNGDEAITGDDCHFGIIGGADILGSDPLCGFAVTPPAALNGHVDLNGDGDITPAGDSCSDGCFFGHDVFHGLVAAGPIDFGEPLFDVATLTGTANQPGTNGGFMGTYTSINATNGPAADGSITFTLVGPDGDTTDCTTEAVSDVVGELNPEVVSVSGDGDYITSGFTPNAPGDYHWKASYDGSSPNTLDTSHNDECDEEGEDVTVRQIPTEIMTKQSWFPNDTATITSSVAGDLLEAGGTVVFTLYETSDCTGDVLYTETETLAGGAHSEEVGTSNGDDPNNPPADFEVTTGYNDAADSEAGPFSWKVVYTPAAGDTAHTGIQSACDAEHFSITYTNDPGPGTDL